MAGYDVPHVTHDMILRFMGVNFSAITDGSAKIPSTLGDVSKPLPALLDDVPSTSPTPGKTPEQDKAMWEGNVSSCITSVIPAADIDFVPFKHTTMQGRRLSFSS